MLVSGIEGGLGLKEKKNLLAYDWQFRSVANTPTLCGKLQEYSLHSLERNPSGAI